MNVARADQAKESPLAIALAYARMGWHVFPLEPRSKQPLTWLVTGGHREATLDAEQITKWWKRAPEAGVGVYLSRSGLIAIDIDPRNGGLETIDQLEAEHGPLVSEVTAITGGGGEHRVFSLPEGMSSTLPGKLGPGVDVKANGYIAVYPSIHPNGRRYEWEASSDPLDGVLPSPLPDWLRGYSRPAQEAASEQRFVPIGESVWAELTSALMAIGSDDRDTWVRVGQALHATGELDRAFKAWDLWSQTSAKYDPRDSLRVWKSFTGRGLSGITYRSIFAMAREAGWRAPKLVEVSAPAVAGPVNDLFATPFKWVDPRSIPPRKWLYGHHYIRKFLSATVAPGGMGKSSLVLVEAVSMALGQDLLNGGQPLPLGPLRVWYYALEDPLDELQRRVAAILIHFGISPSDLPAGHLFLNSGRNQPLVIAEEAHGSLVVAPKVEEGLARVIRAQRIDALILDPYVATHRVDESSNSKQDAIAQVWKRIADDCDCAIELVHHTRKANGSMELSADDMRGASAVRDACRSVRMVSSMSEAEAEKLGVEVERRRFYIYAKDAKANMAPPVDSRSWFHLAGVDLGNGDGVHESDKVGVVEPWKVPDALEVVTPDQCRSVTNRLMQMTDDDRRQFAAFNAAASGWIGHLVGEIVGLDSRSTDGKAQIKRVLNSWVAAKVIQRCEVRDVRQGRMIPCFKAGSAA